MIKVSIIVPIYNTDPNLLIRCVTSIVNQTLEEIEIILIDDCSTTDIGKTITDLTKRYRNRIRSYYSPKNLHQGGARNIGIHMSQGEYIAFVDSDDFVEPNMYELLYKKAIFNGEKADVVECDFITVKQSQLLPIDRMKDISANGTLDISGKKEVIAKSNSTVCTKLFRSSFIKDNDIYFPEGIYYEDHLFVLKVNTLLASYQTIRKGLYYYCQDSSGSTTRTTNLKSCEDRNTIMDELHKWSSMETMTDYKEETEFYIIRCSYRGGIEWLVQNAGWRGYWEMLKLRRLFLKMYPNYRKNQYYIVRFSHEKRWEQGLFDCSVFGYLIYKRIIQHFIQSLDKHKTPNLYTF
ncbi:glycosyltransferase family 2 protein [Diplocloster agilis]|uniref:Glycosyltransferase n=1 Tax=Diplocloster agilis TaxID=2850323 RepID=A0A949NFS8_9FIRM|nr:glycosyltransferase family 2 protein [Diplocloster agilis]MBU9735543.1 glycosyltransferase [Diplocloster agilis]